MPLVRIMYIMLNWMCIYAYLHYLHVYQRVVAYLALESFKGLIRFKSAPQEIFNGHSQTPLLAMRYECAPCMGP